MLHSAFLVLSIAAIAVCAELCVKKLFRKYGSQQRR